MMNEAAQNAKFDGWALVEVFGHQRYAGYVTTEAYGQAVLFRVDVPALKERERTTRAGEYHNGEYCPPGTVVVEGPVQGYSKLFGAGAIYALTPCDEAAALKAVEATQSRPLLKVTLPERPALTAAEIDSENDAYNNADGDYDDEP
jgi:hypothetical protein